MVSDAGGKRRAGRVCRGAATTPEQGGAWRARGASAKVSLRGWCRGKQR